ncbi:MAG: PAS domain S-box protein, partial [Gluconacetobacter diazotrophicus]|nr:PAS domain S-box protein [Gluconacetobacter diazotrophicus]
YIFAPLRRDGVLTATFNVGHTAPRRWRAEEIAIVEEMASRTWDAVERARAQEALRVAEERQRIALEAARMGAWDLDLPTGRVSWNAQHFHLFGLEPDAGPWMVESFLPFVHPDDREAILRWRDALSQETSRTIEYRVRVAGGRVRWLSSFGHAATGADGRAVRLSGVTFDITERREAAETLAATQERLRLIVESALAHGIVSVDPERRITSWSPGAENITGFRAAEMVGESLDTLFLPEDLEKNVPQEEVQEALATGRALCSRWQRRKDGRLFWTTCALLPMRAGTTGEVVGFVKIFSDETEVHQARHELEQSREDLFRALQEAEAARADAEAAGRAKDHFLAVLSHELRTPLMPVLMALGALSRRSDLPPAVRSAHEMIERNVELEARFIDDMLDMTRIARGKLEIIRVDIDLHEVARRAVEVCAPDIQAKGQRLLLALDAAESRVCGDSARLQQALWNLLKNASKFSPDGGEIAVRSRNEPGTVAIEVTDGGIGLEPAVLGHIFQPFEQADSSISRKFGGLGLGLAIAKATVEAHGGRLRASSQGRDQGATFTLSLPLAGGGDL